MRRLSLLAVLACLAPAIVLASTARGRAGKEVAQIEQVTSQIRHLRPLHSVKVVFASDSDFNTIIRNQTLQGSPDSEIQIGQREGVLLGFLKQSDSLRRFLLSGITSAIVGRYDRATRTLYIRNHGGAALGLDRHVIAHEYSHALQDQHFNLTTFLPDQTPLVYRNTDMVGAHDALAEGDALNTEVLYIYRTYSGQELQALTKQESQQSGSVSLPKALKREFYFPYTTGKGFVDALYHRGGTTAIDAAFKHPPQSTYEIMHPSAYLKGWKPTSVILHGLTGLADWKQVDDDVFGALGYNVLLRQFGSGNVADALTSAYRGDRYIFLENSDKNIMFFRSVWASKKAAHSAANALISGLKTRYHNASVSHAGLTIVRDKDGVVGFKVVGTVLSMVYAPTGLLATQVILAPTT